MRARSMEPSRTYAMAGRPTVYSNPVPPGPGTGRFAYCFNRGKILQYFPRGEKFPRMAKHDMYLAVDGRAA